MDNGPSQPTTFDPMDSGFAPTPVQSNNGGLEGNIVFDTPAPAQPQPAADPFFSDETPQPVQSTNISSNIVEQKEEVIE